MIASRLLVTSLLTSILVGVPLRADNELEKRATWVQPKLIDAKTAVEAWLAQKPIDEAVKNEIAALWGQEGSFSQPTDILECVAMAIALVEDAARPLVDVCHQDQPPRPLPDFPFLHDNHLPPLVHNNLRLYYARWLAQHELYDEALEQMTGLQPGDVVDPSALLFYQGVCQHKLLHKDECLATLTKLSENKDALPKRYQTLVALMQADLEPLKTDSLDEVSRLMDDIERRLGFGHAGKRVRQEEDDVVAKLDKMIEELEKQQQQQQQQAGSSGSKQPSKPMEDSQPGGGSGPGEVTQKHTGSRSGWGNLPPKQRQEALQQISKDLPAHYREAIEEYFRKLARDENR